MVLLLLWACGWLTAGAEPPTLRAGGDGFCLLGDEVRCWGGAHQGQHGADFGEPCSRGRCATRPEVVAAYAGADDVQLGYSHTAVLRDGRVLTRGGDSTGQLGLPGTDREVCTVGGDVVPKCVLNVESGQVECAGSTRTEQITLACSSELKPTATEDLAWLRVTHSMTCFGTAEGAAWCSGYLRGLGEAPDRCGRYEDPCARLPHPMETSGAVDIQRGTYGGCVLKADHTVRCGGGAHSTGFDGATDIAEIAVGHQHTCVRKLDGTVWCSGWNAEGQIGNGEVTEPASPTVPPVKVLDGVTAISAGSSTTCAVKTDGALWCWGRNEVGQSGQPAGTVVAAPAKVAGLPPIYQVAVGNESVCAVGRDGSVWCWGADDFGQLGVGQPGTETCRHAALSKGAVPCSSKPVRVTLPE